MPKHKIAPAQALEGRHALVTGAGKGIGAAIAEHLASYGARVTLMGRQVPLLETLAASLPAAQAVAVDVTDIESVRDSFKAAAEGFGSIDILVNNAGQADSAPFGKMSSESWHRMLDVNLTGPFYCVQQVLPAMQAAGWGRIINVASTAGQRGYPFVAGYVAAKHGVVGMTRSLALEVARQGITVNAVCPGYTDTEMVQQGIADLVARTGRSVEEARASFEKFNPQGRLIDVGEVASAVVWLCSDGAASVTGQCLSISGGEVM